jgi:integrative and conjugative element protein (TIGR02256 family)
MRRIYPRIELALRTLRRMRESIVIAYPVGESGQTIILTDSVIAHFRRHRQRRPRHKEAGGQLFARIEGLNITVLEATGPRAKDQRTRTSYAPHRPSEQREIEERHRCNFHFVGDWHTHPELIPSPSHTDARNIAECVKQSKHELNAFLLVVVGSAEPPDGIQVSICDGQSSAILKPSDQKSREPGRSMDNRRERRGKTRQR